MINKKHGCSSNMASSFDIGCMVRSEVNRPYDKFDTSVMENISCGENDLMIGNCRAQRPCH